MRAAGFPGTPANGKYPYKEWEKNIASEERAAGSPARRRRGSICHSADLARRGKCGAPREAYKLPARHIDPTPARQNKGLEADFEAIKITKGSMSLFCPFIHYKKS